MKTKIIIFSIMLCQFSIFSGFSNNPEISKYLKNLSAATNKEAVDDIASEIAVEGNTVHVIWLEDKYGVPNPLYYCRSLDLGNTWQKPVLIGYLVDKQYASQPNNRKMAIDGNHVHIAFCDYNYTETGTGRIYYSRSTNNGASFEPLKILATTGGGYQAITRSFVKASNGKVAVAYVGEGAKTGVWALHSTDRGGTFTDTKVFEEGNDLADFYFDGNQMIFLHSYAYYYYGLNVGRVYVTVSNNNGTIAVTNKVSVTFLESNQQREKCLARQDYHFVEKIAKSGNNIHVVFEGQTETAAWTNLYARSTNDGTTFEKAIDINGGTISNIQGGQETILANNGNVYIAYLSTQNPVYFSYSNNSGNTFSKPIRITPADVSHISGTWWIGLVNDPTDVTGNSFYLTGNYMYSARSTDGGKSFSKFSLAVPFVKSVIAEIKADMVLDSKGGMHWISETKLKNGTDRDIMYRHVLMEPEPGNINKALYIKNVKNTYETETVVVPSSSTINLDSTMTAEAWVKFPPGNEDVINILAKINGFDNYDNTPSGYNMGFRVQNTGKLCINSGIKTDKGDFVNWGDCTIADTLWHHVAFTYDANAGINNLKTYVDGVLSVQQTAYGKIITGEGLLLIGARGASSSWYTSQNYYIDDVRIWNKALSQTQLMANQVRKFTGKEEGLKLYINFDDTFKDITDNGNDGIPINNGFIPKSDFNPPINDFEMYQTGKEISFNNKTTNATSSIWDFGNNVNSVQGNPRYTYPTPGEYKVILVSKNSNSVTSAIKGATITGLNRIEPTSAGNKGSTAITVFGGGLTVEGTTMLLRKTGNPDIVGSNLSSATSGVLTSFFDLTNAALGKWDVIVKKGTSENVLPAAFAVVPAVLPNTWVKLTGRSSFLPNRWASYTIEYGNSGNIDAFFVPVVIAFSDNGSLEIDQLDFEVQKLGITPEVVRDDGTVDGTEIFDGKEYNTKNIMFVLPSIRANSGGSFHIRIKANETFFVRTWDYQPLIENNADFGKFSRSGNGPRTPNSFASCMVEAFVLEGIQFAGAQALEFNEVAEELAACYSAATVTYGATIADGIKHELTGKKFAVSLIGLTADCLPAFLKMNKIIVKNNPWVKFGLPVLKLALNAFSCYEYGTPTKGSFIDHQNTSKFSKDPNEMIGPTGYGNQHWIQKTNILPYTILFENKSDATAPAHEVFITDTLDLKKFDISEFGFGAFGWGDSIYLPLGNKLKQFSRDIDLRPRKKLITRVSGKLDTLSGAVKWEFLSLNPTTMDYEEDPDIGFLPPNDTSRTGEGFVSFSIGLKKELKTNDVLKNKASIVFDANAPIITNEYINTLDLDKPESRVLALPTTNKNRFQLSWGGIDAGSGIAFYDVYVMQNDTALRLWKSRTPLESAEFIGNLGSKYQFYSIATDNVSLVEENPSNYDAETSITVNVQEFENKKGNIILWPNPAKFSLNVQFADAPSGLYVLETINFTGSTILSKLYTDADVKGGVSIDVSDYNPGLYLIKIVYRNQSKTLKFIVQ